MNPADFSPDRRGLRLPLYRVVAGGLASEEISRPGVIRLSDDAIANTPVLEDGSSVR